MRPKPFLLVTLVGLGVLLALWFLRQRSSTESPVDNPTESPMQPAQKPGVAVAKAIPGENRDGEGDNMPTDQAMLHKLAQLAARQGVSLHVLTQQSLTQLSNMLQEMGRTVNRGIDFYGKAVDENGQPLPGATVKFGCIIYPEEHFATNTLTDARGLFSLNSVTGATLTVLVAKDGYVEVQGTNQNKFDYYLEGFRSDSNNPVVFRLRKLGVERK